MGGKHRKSTPPPSKAAGEKEEEWKQLQGTEQKREKGGEGLNSIKLCKQGERRVQNSAAAYLVEL